MTGAGNSAVHAHHRETKESFRWLSWQAAEENHEKAFKQAQVYISKLLTGLHPALPGKKYSLAELENSITKAKGHNNHDARNFFRPDALFKQYLTGQETKPANLDISEKLLLATSQIINLYLREVNQACKEGETDTVRKFLCLLLSDPKVLGFHRRFPSPRTSKP